MPTDRTRDEEVERLKGIGATVHEDHRKPDGPHAPLRHVFEYAPGPASWPAGIVLLI